MSSRSAPPEDGGEPWNVVVIGAGPAGLTAAWELTRHGRRPLVLEREGHVGGLAHTAEYKGFHFDLGGHRFFTKVPEVQELWQEILGADLLRRPRLSRIYYNQRFFRYPLQPGNALKRLGVVESARVVGSYLWSRLFPYRRVDTFEHWVTNRFGRRLFEIFFKAYTEKVWGISCSELKAEWAAQRIKNLSLPAALLGMVWKPGTRIPTLIEDFHYPRQGPGMMWNAVRREVVRAGGEVRLGSEVVAIRHRDRRVTGLIVRRDGRPEIVESRHFITTMPLRDLVGRLEPPPPDAVARAAARLAYRDFLTVCLIVRREQVFPDTWIYVHDPGVRVSRIQNFKNWSPAMVPDPMRTSLGLEYFCAEGDDLWRMADRDLVELASREVEAIGLVGAAEIEDGCVMRVPQAYPVYDSSYAESLDTVRRYVDGLQNLQTIGRNGLHRYNNQDHAMLTGLVAARNVVRGLREDVWSVNTDQTYHEAIVEPRVKRRSASPGWLLAAILAVALAVRVLHFIAIADTALPLRHLTASEADDHAFYRWAQTIRSGDLLGRDTYHPYFLWMREMAPLDTWYRWWGGKEIFHQAPLYPYLLAALLGLLGDSVRLVLLAQLLLGAFQPLVMFCLCRRLFGDAAALLAAALAALYGPLIFYHGVLLRDWLPPLLEPLALAALLRARDRGSLGGWMVAGAILALAVLARETALLLIVVALLWIVLEHRSSRPAMQRALAATFVGLLLAFSPLLARNLTVGAPAFALSNRVAEVFALSNSADLRPEVLRPIMERSERGVLPLIHATLDTHTGGWSHVARAVGRKLALIAVPYEVPNNVSFAYGVEQSALLAWIPGYAILFPLGVGGLLLRLRRGRGHSLLLLYALAGVAGIVVTNGISRYRLVLVPVLILGAAGLVARVAEGLRARRWPAVSLALAVVMAAVLVQHVLQGRQTIDAGPYALDYLAAAAAYGTASRPDRAASELARFRTLAAGHDHLRPFVDQAARAEGSFRVERALRLWSSGQTEAARREGERAAELLRPYQHLPEPNLKLGALYYTFEEPAQATPLLKRYLILRPEGPEAAVAWRLLNDLAGSEADRESTR